MISEYTVTGMSCDHCVHSVTTELLAIPNVTDVTVDLPTGLVQIASLSPLALEDVSATVDEAGYELASAN